MSLNCFLIDDDPDDKEIFCMALEDMKQKISCTYARDGIEALRKLEDIHFRPDYIFIDMNMPRMNGNKCLEEIKKIDRIKEVPVFMYSTSADPSIVAETRQLGAAGFIVKPTSILELTKTLTIYLK